MRRGAALLVAAALAAGAMSSVALAAQPGGGLYGARVWAETLTLPASPRERAVAELARLDERLAEITSATARGDDAAAEAALAAYQSILESAAASALLSDDAIAMLTIEEGARHNITVLNGLVAILPDRASDAVEHALQRAIDRSTETVDGIGNDTAPNGGGSGNGPDENDAGGNGGGPAATPDPAATPKPTKEPKPTSRRPSRPRRRSRPRPPLPSRRPTSAPSPPDTATYPGPAEPPARGGGGGGGGGGNPGTRGSDADEQSQPTPRGQGD